MWFLSTKMQAALKTVYAWLLMLCSSKHLYSNDWSIILEPILQKSYIDLAEPSVTRYLILWSWFKKRRYEDNGAFWKLTSKIFSKNLRSETMNWMTDLKGWRQIELWQLDLFWRLTKGGCKSAAPKIAHPQNEYGNLKFGLAHNKAGIVKIINRIRLNNRIPTLVSIDFSIASKYIDNDIFCTITCSEFKDSYAIPLNKWGAPVKCSDMPWACCNYSL